MVSTTHARYGAGARFDRGQFRLRLAIVLVLSLAAAWLPAAGENRAWIALILLGVVAPAHLLLRRVTGLPNPTGWIDLLAIGAGTAVSAIEPGLWTAAFLFQMMVVAGTTAFTPPVWTARLAAASLTTMGAVAVLRPMETPIAHLVVAATFVPALLVGANQKRERERKSTVRLDTLAESVPVLVWEADLVTGSLHWVTGRVEELLGVSRPQLRSDGFGPHVHPDEADDHFRRLRGRDTSLASLEYRFIRPDGAIRWLRDQVEWVTTTDGKVLRGVTTDITDERTNRLGLDQRQQIIDRLDQLTLVLDRIDERFVVSQASDPFGWIPDDAIGRDLVEVLPDLANARRLQAALARIRQERSVRLDPTISHDPEGRVRHLEIEVCGLPGGSIGMLVADVTEREEANARILHQARHDELTDLVNRGVLLAEIAERFESGERLALLLLDLNGFKNINDTLGHLTGDEVLKVIAARLRRVVPDSGIIARLGGDEFAILVPRDGEVETIVQQVLTRCREPVSIGSVAVVLGASVGISFGPGHADDAEGLLRCADVAMYAAKRNEQGHRYYTSDLAADHHNVELMADLHEAFVSGRFELQFQPKVDVATERIVGAEALVRWRHPQRGLLAPGDFLGLVSIAGYGDELADVTVTLAARAVAALPEPLRIAVNLTANNLRRRDLAERVRVAAAAEGVGLERLVFEITESHVIDGTGVVHHTIHELAAAGAGISIDDFGTGYSSMVNLRSLPINELKVDRTFVEGMRTNPNDAAIVRSVIDLGHSLGLSVTAEGVEDVETLGQLRRLGCDVSQGFLHARPLALEELLAMVAAAPSTTR